MRRRPPAGVRGGVRSPVPPRWHAGPRSSPRLSFLRSFRPVPPVPPSRERGSVTAEIAVALPALVLVSLALLWGTVIAAAQIACVDAVRSGARAAARGEPLTAVRAAVIRAAPDGARVTIRRDSELTRVEVRVRPRPAFGRGLPHLVIEEHAVAMTEPGVAP